MGLNEDIRDMVIQHQHHVERFKTGEVRKVNALLNQADRRLRNLLANTEITTWNRRRFQGLLDAVRQLESATARALDRSISTSAKAFGGVEAQALGGIVDEAAGELLAQATVSYTVPSTEAVWTAANVRPLTLNNNTAVILDPYINSISRSRLLAIERSLRFSSVVGESLQEATRRLMGTPSIRGALNGSRRTAETVTRTVMNHMSSSARRLSYDRNKDVVNGYQWVSTLDRRTSEICQDFDGKVWFTTDEEIDASAVDLLPSEVYPPAHPNCRSTTVPIMKSWRQLGIDRNKISASTRASANGQVPESTTYHQWLERQSAAVQRDALGATRYMMHQQGVSFTAFHAKDGRFFSLEQLRTRGVRVPPRSAVLANR